MYSGAISGLGMMSLFEAAFDSKILAASSILGALKPVSYTHLDVYKRQGQGYAIPTPPGM